MPWYAPVLSEPILHHFAFSRNLLPRKICNTHEIYTQKISNIYIYISSGWWFQPLWKTIKLNWDDYSQDMEKMLQSTNQYQTQRPNILFRWFFSWLLSSYDMSPGSPCRDISDPGIAEWKTGEAPEPCWRRAPSIDSWLTGLGMQLSLNDAERLFVHIASLQ